MASLVGKAVKAKGTLADFSNLADVTSPEAGWAYNITGGASAGHQFIYDGATWVDMGDIRGIKGDKGDKGDTGDKGDAGIDGASAFEVAQNAGFQGTEAQWLQSLIGPGLVAKGHVTDSSDLLNITNPVAGWVYNVLSGADAGHQFIYNGSD